MTQRSEVDRKNFTFKVFVWKTKKEKDRPLIMPLSGEPGEWQNQFHIGVVNATPKLITALLFRSGIINSQKIMEKRVCDFKLLSCGSWNDWICISRIIKMIHVRLRRRMYPHANGLSIPVVIPLWEVRVRISLWAFVVLELWIIFEILYGLTY